MRCGSRRSSASMERCNTHPRWERINDSAHRNMYAVGQAQPSFWFPWASIKRESVCIGPTNLHQQGSNEYGDMNLQRPDLEEQRNRNKIVGVNGTISYPKSSCPSSQKGVITLLIRTLPFPVLRPLSSMPMSISSTCPKSRTGDVYPSPRHASRDRVRLKW